jgi:phosphatidylethanolamine-binding protein (PEBP) family uncharacterized protein
MRYQSFALLAAAGLTSALTPAGFQPQSQTQLFVQYGNQAALNGQVISQQGSFSPKDTMTQASRIDNGVTVTQVQPTISLGQQLRGTYAVIMVDLDIPSDTGGPTNTLLHWMQTGLTLSTQATQLQSANGGGNQQVFLLQNRGNAAPLAEYLGPNPPARNPLSHRYTFVLVDHSSISQQGLQALTQAAQTRRGFDTANVLRQAGISNNVVAGNFFNVTNSGQVQPGIGGPALGNGTTGGIIPGGNQPGSPLVPGSTPGGLLPGNAPGATNVFSQPAASGIAQSAGGVTVSAKSGVAATLLLVAGLFFAF